MGWIYMYYTDKLHIFHMNNFYSSLDVSTDLGKKRHLMSGSDLGWPAASIGTFI